MRGISTRCVSNWRGAANDGGVPRPRSPHEAHGTPGVSAIRFDGLFRLGVPSLTRLPVGLVISMRWAPTGLSARMDTLRLLARAEARSTGRAASTHWSLSRRVFGRIGRPCAAKGNGGPEQVFPSGRTLESASWHRWKLFRGRRLSLLPMDRRQGHLAAGS
jgi:hypothetical protein